MANASEAVQSQRRDDAAFMETKIAKSMVKTLHKQSTGSKAPHVLFAMEDAPEWIYVALHASAWACQCARSSARSS